MTEELKTKTHTIKNETTNPITFNFLDAPTGAGKTTAIIHKVNQEIPVDNFGNPKRFLIVTPYNDEVTKICNLTPCIQPVGNKSEDIRQLFASGKNICCTHALFALFNTHTLAVIQECDYDYYLIIDEEISTITNIVGCKRVQSQENPSLIERYSKDDFSFLETSGQLITDLDTNEVSWNYGKPYEGIFEELRDRLEVADIFKFGSGVIQLTKKELWSCFAEVTICSYRMQESYINYYCQLYQIPVKWQHIEGNNIVDGYLSLKPVKLDRVRVYTDQRNQECSYSKRWYMEHLRPRNDYMHESAKNLAADFRKFRETFVPKDVDKRLYYWTCYKGFERAFAGKNLSLKKWQPCNLRATNKLTGCQVVGYWINRFANVNVKRFLYSKGIVINEREMALSDLIQYVWRSNIRTHEDKDVYVFIASGELMDNFIEWLE